MKLEIFGEKTKEKQMKKTQNTQKTLLTRPVLKHIRNTARTFPQYLYYAPHALMAIVKRLKEVFKINESSKIPTELSRWKNTTIAAPIRTTREFFFPQ